MRMIGWSVAAGLVCVCGAIPAEAQTDSQASYQVFDGAIGSYRVRAVIEVAPDHRTIRSARYYYATKLADIPLQARNANGAVTMREGGGGMFRLHFVGNGSNGAQPLDFYNSVGLAGDWTSGGRTLPVKLNLDTARPADGGRWYADATTRSDAAFEATVRRWQHGVVGGQRGEVAAATHFPLRVNGAKPVTVRNAADLNARWSAIFTPSYVAKIRTAIPKDMMVRNGQAMLADGAAWFDDKGAVAINPSMR